MVQSRRRLPCLEGAFPVENCLRKSSENWRVECEFQCDIPFASQPCSSFPCIFWFPFFLCKAFPCFLSVFPFFSRDFRSALPKHINLISPQNAENGDPKIQNRDGPGNSGEIQGFCRISTETLDPGKFREIRFGDPILAIWGIFWGKWEWPKLICWAGVNFWVQHREKSCFFRVNEKNKERKIRECDIPFSDVPFLRCPPQGLLIIIALGCRKQELLGHTPSAAGTFRKKNSGKTPETTLTLQSLLFRFPCFFVFRFPLLFLCVFPFFSKDFEGFR